MPRADSGTKAPMRKKAWIKVTEALRPAEKRKRRAREFDTIMRREIGNPIRDVEIAERHAAESEGDLQDYQSMVPAEPSSPLASPRTGNWGSALGHMVEREAPSGDMDNAEQLSETTSESSSIMSTIEEEAIWDRHDAGGGLSLLEALTIEPAQGEEDDEITALPEFPVHQQTQTLMKKERKRLRKTKSMTYGGSKEKFMMTLATCNPGWERYVECVRMD